MTVDIDPLGLARDLIRRPSVTPRDEGALDVLEGALTALGFTCHRLTFREAGTADVDNLYARVGAGAPNLAFAGHTDVVPAGDAEAWSVDPFAGAVMDGTLFGRGAADMKGAIACFVAAVARFLGERGKDFTGSISLVITGDEEGPAINGTAKLLEWLAERGERLDACLIGEPTSAERLGDTVKIGRRGSLNARLTVRGVQGHTAYPDLARNPIPALMAMLAAVTEDPLDAGSDNFQPSTIEVTTIDVGNPVTNIIPAVARAGLNIRFNDLHAGSGLTEWLRERFGAVAAERDVAFELDVAVSGEAFLSPEGPLTRLIAETIDSVAGAPPRFGTSGGTSDGRFIHRHCPVAEIGLSSRTMHKVDECVAVQDLRALTEIYKGVLDRFFPVR